MTDNIPQEAKDKAAAFCKERSLPLGSERRAAAYSGFIAGYLKAKAQKGNLKNEKE